MRGLVVAGRGEAGGCSLGPGSPPPATEIRNLLQPPPRPGPPPALRPGRADAGIFQGTGQRNRSLAALWTRWRAGYSSAFTRMIIGLSMGTGSTAVIVEEVARMESVTFVQAPPRIPGAA